MCELLKKDEASVDSSSLLPGKISMKDKGSLSKDSKTYESNVDNPRSLKYFLVMAVVVVSHNSLSFYLEIPRG